MAKKVTTTDWLKANKVCEVDNPIDAIVKACKVSHKTARDAIRRNQRKAAMALVPVGGVSESLLRAKHDALFILRNAAKSLVQGIFYTESEFREKVCKLDSNKFRSKADLNEFDQYKGRASGITYWSHPKSIRSVKEDGVLQ